ncbi:hypothetical protein [Streptomyces hirsutus]|uniref:hypothetical protein n=1 Tax=Streptomyces hirsutus TaxID=35620 RepID=UPI003694840C
MQIHPIVLRRAEVARVVDITPNMRRITLTGADLAAGEMGAGFARPLFLSDGFDVMSGGRVAAEGPPADVLTTDLLRDVFAVDAAIIEDPVNGGPRVITRHRGRTAAPEDQCRKAAP